MPVRDAQSATSPLVQGKEQPPPPASHSWASGDAASTKTGLVLQHMQLALRERGAACPDCGLTRHWVGEKDHGADRPAHLRYEQLWQCWKCAHAGQAQRLNNITSSQPSSPADCNKVASTAGQIAAAKRDPGPSVSTAVPTSRLDIAGGADASGLGGEA